MILCPAPVFFVKLFVPNVEIINIFCEFFLEYKSDSAALKAKNDSAIFSLVFPVSIPVQFRC